MVNMAYLNIGAIPNGFGVFRKRDLLLDTNNAFPSIDSLHFGFLGRTRDKDSQLPVFSPAEAEGLADAFGIFTDMARKRAERQVLELQKARLDLQQIPHKR